MQDKSHRLDFSEDLDTQAKSTWTVTMVRISIVCWASVVVSCGVVPAGTVLKAPAQERCESLQLKGCPDIADGVVAYVDGNKSLALKKLQAAALQNSPDDVQALAAQLKTLSSVPGAGNLAPALGELSKVLVEQSAQATVAEASRKLPEAVPGNAPDAGSFDEEAEEAKSVQRARDDTLLALAATTDITRSKTETVAPSMFGKPCQIAGVPAICAARRTGPLYVSDVIAGRDCPDGLFVAAGAYGSTTFDWWIEATNPGIHGAQLSVPAGGWLYVVQSQNGKQLSTDFRCVVTWAGYRPRVVPPVMRSSW